MNTSGAKTESMLGIGSITKCMATGLSNGQMGGGTKDNTKTTKNKEKEHSIGQMVENI